MTRPTRSTAGGPVAAAILALVLGGLLPCALSAAASAQVVDAVDYGVVPDSTVDNTPALQRALDVAVFRRQPGRWAVVQLPAGVIGYRGVLRINADSLEIRGVGGAVLTRDRTADGAAYYPVRRLDRVRPGAAVTVLRVLSGSFVPGRLRPTRWIVWSRGRTARRWHRLRLSHLVMDGNVAGNVAGLRAIGQGGSKPSKKSFLQDGVGHTALAANGHDRAELCADGPGRVRLPGGRTVRRTGSQVGTLVSVDHVAVEGYTATGLVGNRCTRWRGHVVRGANAFYNHVFYHVDGGVGAGAQDPAPGDAGPLQAWGGWRHVTLAGGAWTHWVSQSGLRVENLVFEDPEPNPLRSNADLFDVRWGTVFVDGFAAADPIPRRFWTSNGGELVLDADADVVPPDSLIVLPVRSR